MDLQHEPTINPELSATERLSRVVEEVEFVRLARTLAVESAVLAQLRGGDPQVICYELCRAASLRLSAISNEQQFPDEIRFEAQNGAVSGLPPDCRAEYAARSSDSRTFIFVRSLASLGWANAAVYSGLGGSLQKLQLGEIDLDRSAGLVAFLLENDDNLELYEIPGGAWRAKLNEAALTPLRLVADPNAAMLQLIENISRNISELAVGRQLEPIALLSRLASETVGLMPHGVGALSSEAIAVRREGGEVLFTGIPVNLRIVAQGQIEDDTDRRFAICLPWFGDPSDGLVLIYQNEQLRRLDVRDPERYRDGSWAIACNAGRFEFGPEQPRDPTADRGWLKPPNGKRVPLINVVRQD